MKDIIKKYHKKKTIGTLGIIGASLIVALGVNFFVIDGTETGQRLKANIIESSIEIENKADLYLEKQNENTIILKTNKQINNLKNLSLSLMYNPENVVLGNIIGSKSKIDVINLANTPGINTIILSYGQSENISAGATLLEIETSKITQKLEHLNIIVDTIQFSDNSGNTYSPTTSGVSF